MNTPESLKSDIETSYNKLHNIISDIWNQEEITCDWKKGLIVKLPKTRAAKHKKMA